MKKTNRRAPGSWLRRCLWGLLVGFVILVIAGLTAPQIIRCHKDPLLGYWHHLGQISCALATYSGENGGKLPPNLETVGSSGDTWTYFPEITRQDRPDSIIVALAKSFSKADGTYLVGTGPHKMVLSLDGRRILLKEADYLKCVRDQQHPSWKSWKPIESPDPWEFLTEPLWHTGRELVSPDPLAPQEVRKYIRQLNHSIKTTRWDASGELGDHGPPDKEVIDALLHALSVPDAGYHSAHGLARLSIQDRSVVPRLITVLESGDRASAYWAAVALEEIGLQNARAAILPMTGKLFAEGDIPNTAAKALAGAGPHAADAVPQLIKLARSDRSWASKCAVIALGRIGPQARQALAPPKRMLDSGHGNRIDLARALCRIDPAQASKLVPMLVAEIKSQQSSGKHGQPMDHAFFSAIDLLGEIGPQATAAIPVLQANLKGSAAINAAWALWRIDPGFSETATRTLTRYLTVSTRQPDRLDQLARNTGIRRNQLHSGKPGFDHSFAARIPALGALWQMHPDKREALMPLLVTLLREWEREKVLKKLYPNARTALPALHALLESEIAPDLRTLAIEVKRKIETTDPGRW